MGDGEDEGVVEVGGVFGEERMVAPDWRILMSVDVVFIYVV